MNLPTRAFRSITRAWTLALCLGAALLSYAGQPAPARACYVAHQYRVFPLGVQGDRMIAVLIEQTRYSEDMKSAILWRAELSLVELGWFGEPQRVLASERVQVTDRAYARELRPALARAFTQAQALPGFEAFSAPQTRFCDLEERCGYARWSRTPEGRLAVNLKIGAASLRDAAVVPQRVQKQLYEDSTSIYQLWPPRLLMDVFAEYPDPFSSVRVYRAGARTVFVAHATGGQMVGEGADGEFDMVSGRLSRLPRGACKDVSSCMYAEPIPHHGRGFDMVLTVGETPPPTRVIEKLPEEADDYGWTDADRRAKQERERLEKAERARKRAEREALRFQEQARREAAQQWPLPDLDEDEE